MAESETMSVDTSLGNPDEHIVDLSDDQLAQHVADTIRANEVLALETQMFEKYLKRAEPRELDIGLHPPIREKQAFGSNATLSSHSDQGTSSRLARKRSKSRGSALEKSLRLNPEQKCDIAQRELEEYQQEVKKLNDESEKILDTLRAVMEEADVRLAEIKKEEYEFERDIVRGASNLKTGTVNAEKVIKYLEERLRARETLVVKLRLRNEALKVSKKKLQLQLRQKEEMGEVLHEVDFSQLKIENQQYIEKIDERNQELLHQKLMAGNSLQVLNSYKKRLNTLMMESDRLKLEIAARNELLARIDGETQLVEEERTEAERINRRLRQQMSDYRVPDVIDYVQEKADLYEIRKKVKSWERKVDIAEASSEVADFTHFTVFGLRMILKVMALKTNRKIWEKIQMSDALKPALQVQWR